MTRPGESRGGLGGRTDLAIEKADVDQIATRLSALGQDFGNLVYPLLDQIRQLEAPRPWGGDAFGQKFAERVYDHPLTDGTPFNQALHTVLDQAGRGLTDFATRTSAAVTGYRQADHLPGQPRNRKPR